MNTVDITSLETENIESSVSTWRDWVGIIASIGCAIHCAAMPFVIAYLPAWGLSFLADEAFHKWMALICFLIAIAAFVPGLRKHGNWFPVSVGAIGLVFITFAAFGLAGECCSSCAETSTTPTQSASAETGCAEECCPSCAETATMTSTTPIQSASAETGCIECDECQSCSEVGSTACKSQDEDESLLSTLAPWITPFGGLMLVAAHLLNRRYGCLCGCC